MDLFAHERLPIIPEQILKSNRAYHPHDTRFRASARLLQSLWRDRRNMPMGKNVTKQGKRRDMGHLVNQLCQLAGANFLSNEVHKLVRREVAYREPGAAIDEPRLRGNLLSSMPLAFNLFGPLKLDPTKARAVLKKLFPTLVHKIAHIQFEHSPARGDLQFTADGTAFDVFISCVAKDGRKTFVAIEVKYSEGCYEPTARLRPRYDTLSESSGLYQDHAADDLRTNPLQQLWREHMLAQAMVDNGLYDAGVFVVIAPGLNTQVQRAAALYTSHLAAYETKVAFHNITLETFVDTMRTAGCEGEALWLTERYLDFGPVHALI